MRTMVILAAVVMGGCGGTSARSAEEVVRAWGSAVNARDWAQACELEHAPAPDCEERRRRDFATVKLTFDGPAESGGAGPVEEPFSFSAADRTVFVAALKRGDEYRARLEAIVMASSVASDGAVPRTR